MQKDSTKCYSSFTYFFLLFNFVTICALHSEQIAPQNADFTTLKFVHILWRHGVRTPTTEMANEPRDWKQGLGELTTKGMGQLYRLGLWIRRRYDGFISPNYSSFEVYVRSSDFNRTLMSAQALLAGLYPPSGNKSFEPGLNWQPIPVHTEPKDTDRVIFDGSNCAPMAAEEQHMFDSTEVKTIEHANADFLQFLAVHSGFEQTSLPLRETRYVFDSLICIKLNGEGKALPKWANDSVIERVWQLNDISSSYLYNTTKLVRFRAGVIFSEILQRMKNVQQNDYDVRQRIHAYSAHDTTLAGVLAAFGIHPSPFPHFATALFIELHQHQVPMALPHSDLTTNYSIRLFYRNETDVETLLELTIPDCPSACTLDRLRRVRASIMTTKEEQSRECSGDGSSSANFAWTLNDLSVAREHIYIALIGVLSLLCAVLLFYILCRSSVARAHRRKGREWKRRRKMKCTTHIGSNTATTMGQPLLLVDEEEEEDDEIGQRQMFMVSHQQTDDQNSGQPEKERWAEERRKEGTKTGLQQQQTAHEWRDNTDIDEHGDYDGL